MPGYKVRDVLGAIECTGYTGIHCTGGAQPPSHLADRHMACRLAPECQVCCAPLGAACSSLGLLNQRHPLMSRQADTCFAATLLMLHRVYLRPGNRKMSLPQAVGEQSMAIGFGSLASRIPEVVHEICSSFVKVGQGSRELNEKFR